MLKPCYLHTDAGFSHDCHACYDIAYQNSLDIMQHEASLLVENEAVLLYKGD